MPEITTESEIVDSMSKGDIRAFDILYKKYHKAVFSNILKLIYQADIAEDLLQDVFITLWEFRKKIDADQDIAGWLFIVSQNKSLAFLKKRVREKIIFNGSIPDVVVVNDAECDDMERVHLYQLTDAVNSLSPRKQIVFRLCRLQGKSYAEAARIMGVSTETVKDYIKESYKLIRKFLLSKNQLTNLSIYILTLYLPLLFPHFIMYTFCS